MLLACVCRELQVVGVDTERCYLGHILDQQLGTLSCGWAEP